jgi:ArsR family transcriptional regulator, virulence genes transcriptional regulator
MKNNMKNIDKAVELLKTISNKNRLMILCGLNKGELSVSQMVEDFSLSQSSISQHLSLMRGYGFVNTRRDNKSIYYSLASKEIKEVIDVLHSNYCNLKE